MDSDDTALNGIWTIRSSDGGGLLRLTHNPHGDDIPGSWSPDGRWLSFVRDRLDQDGNATAIGLFLVRADGTGLHRLTPRGVLTNPEHGGRWSADGRRILFDARPDEDSRFTLFTIDARGRHVTRIPTSLPCGTSVEDPASFGCFAPAWSPNDRSLVFGTLDAATGRRDLYTMRLDGSHLTRITHGKAAFDVPDWSPGRHTA